MAYDTARLVRDVAERLGVAADGQPADPDDEVRIRNSLTEVVEDLHGRDVFSIADLEDIEPGAFGHLAAIVASHVSDRFSTDDALAARLAGRAQVAENKLRIIKALPASGGTHAALFY